MRTGKHCTTANKADVIHLTVQTNKMTKYVNYFVFEITLFIYNRNFVQTYLQSRQTSTIQTNIYNPDKHAICTQLTNSY